MLNGNDCHNTLFEASLWQTCRTGWFKTNAISSSPCILANKLSALVWHLWSTEGNWWQQIFFSQDWDRIDVESKNMELPQTCVNAWPNSKQLFFQWHWSIEWTQKHWVDTELIWQYVCEWAFKVSVHGQVLVIVFRISDS